MSIVSVLEEQLNAVGGDSEVIVLPMLVKAGICGSNSAAKHLLKTNSIPFIRIGNRTLLSKKDVVKFLHDHCSSKEEVE